MNLRQFFLIVRGRWRVLVATFLTVVALVVGATLLLPKQYTATASVVADNNKSDPVTPVTLQSDPQSFMLTQVGILTSDRVTMEAARSLHYESTDLYHRWENSKHGNLDFTAWFAKLLRKAVRVSGGAEGNIIEISAQWTDAQKSADIANAIAQAYLTTSIALKTQPAQQYAGLFNDRARELRADLQAKQQRLVDFQNEKGIIPTDERIDVESARLAELSTQQVVVQGQRQDSQSRQRQIAGHADSSAEVLQSALIANLKAQVATDEAKQQDLATNLGVNHPEYKRLEAEIVSLRRRIELESNRIAASLHDSTEIVMRREADVNAAVEAQKRRLLELKQSRDQAGLLQNDIVVAQRNLDAVTQRLAQSSLEGQVEQSNAVLLAAATAPDEPSSPNLPINGVVGVFFGLVLGVGAVLLAELLNGRVRAKEDLEEALEGVPVLAKIAAIPWDRGYHGAKVAGLLSAGS
jgi:chain length determinant protein EpsF